MLVQFVFVWIRFYFNIGDVGEIIFILGVICVDCVIENLMVVEIIMEEKEELDKIVKFFFIVGYCQIFGVDYFFWIQFQIYEGLY